jgi:ATP-dependent exoDNAse (exonuclease V) alpha subunit
MYHNIQKLRENPDTENVGKKWSEDEINNLLVEIKKNLSLDDIAKIHKRTSSSVRSRLFTIAISLIHKNMDIDEVSRIVNLSSKSIQDYIEKYPTKKTKTTSESNENKNLTADEILKLMGPSVSSLLNIPVQEEININIEKKEIRLNYEQESALKAFKSGKNIFLTGPAGTGKSVTLGKIKEYCNQNSKNIGVTATTGTAAFLLGGKTLHSYTGIGLAKESAEELYFNIRKFKHITDRLRSCEVLIIDEISMLDADLLDKLSEYLQIMRKISKPFGGIQLVLTGDFCQLEPVSGDYCFKSKIWPLLELKIIYLHKLIRQDGDLQFQNILSKLRYGKCSQKTFELLSSMSDKDFGEVKPTILYPRNFDVDKINKLESEKLIASGAKKEIYEIEYPRSKNKDKAQRWVKSLDVPDSVSFCVGDQVVVTANIDQESGIVNGTRGVVIDVKSRSVIIKKINGVSLEIKYFKSTNAEDSNLSVMYIPLKLAYALSIHKSQGMTLDAIEIDIGSKIFAAGQAYTALSRAQSLSSVKIKSISKKSFIIHPDVLQFYEKIEEDIKIKNDKFIDKYLHIILNNIANHVNLDNTLDFIWDFIPEDEEELLKFFNNLSNKKLDIE